MLAREGSGRLLINQIYSAINAWFKLETILNNNDIKQTSWVNHIISLDGQYKPRNCLNNVTFTLLIMNRCKWYWFRLETILNNNDLKKTSWVNLIISLEKQYKHRNCLNNASFTLLIMKRCKWNWFRLETILNNNDINKYRELTLQYAWIDNTSLETALIM